MAEEKTSPKGPVTRKFKAEVKQVLDIVIHSLYTHREIFIRELVSNASDAMEKMRHETLTIEEYVDKDVPFEITITTDKDNHTISISDTGIGMTFDELTENLGTIARSGTLEYMKRLAESDSEKNELIGKFGVGFYSAFMAGDRVEVVTRSYKPDETGYRWTSDGIGEYKITPEENAPRGTTITVHLKEDAQEYENPDRIKEIVQKYSNFVPFPIKVGDEVVNTVQAIWLKSSSELTDEEYNEFYKFLANAHDDPLFRLHLTADAPIQLASIMYIPTMNLEQFGFMKLKPGVNLYCRKILLQQHTENLLPEYLRFVKGVVDSEDLSLNISRETIQDDLVFRKLGKFLTKRIFKFLAGQATKEPEKYRTFWDTFGMFIKEGAVSDHEHKEELTELLRFASSMEEDGELVSLDQYVKRMREEQKEIYYITGANRTEIESGPYVETFKRRGLEVLYLYDPIDDFIMTSLMEHDGKKLVSADSADLDLPPIEDGEKDKDKSESLSSKEVTNLAKWMQDTLGDKVKEVRESKRILDRPAIIVNPDAGMTQGMRRIMKASGRDFMPSGPQVLEINPAHPIIVTIKKLRDGKGDKGFLQSCVEQIHDNALTEAGLMENPRPMVERINSILERALKEEEAKEG